MTNPARRLHEIFVDWRAQYGPSTSAYEVRGWHKSPSPAVETHLEVFRLLLSIRNALDYLEAKGISISTYRQYYEQWMQMALHVPNNWTGSSDPQQGFPAEPLAHLDTLATLLDVDRPALHPDPEAKLRTVVAEVFDLLATDESLSEHLREYVFKLANEIRTALDDEAITGSFDFAAAAERLWVAVYAAAGQSRKASGKWKTTARRLFLDSAAGAIGSSPSLGLTIAQISGVIGAS